MSNIEKKPFIQRIDKKIRIAAAGVVLAASLGMGMEACQTNQPDKPGITTTISGETAQPRLTSENWMTIPQDQIANYAIVPSMDVVEEGKYASTVSPILQEKAQAIGYTIIYQEDPNDTTGRSIVTEYRQDSKGGTMPTYEDLGFGENLIYLKGVFKAWVPKPSDPQQKNDVYALLENPLTKEDYLVDVKLGTTDFTSTRFLIDNLNKGYKDVLSWINKNHNYIEAVMLPDDPTDFNAADSKTYSDFPTFNDLLKKQGINLDDIAQPGDYIVTLPEGSFKAGNTKDENGVTRINGFTVRRFGGTAEWNQEVGIK